MLEDVFLEYITRVLSLFPTETDSFDPAATITTQSAVIYAHNALCILFLIMDSFRFSVFSESISHLFRRRKCNYDYVACANAFANIFITFGDLILVDESYISLGIILIILLIFIGALFLTVVSLNQEGHLKCDDDNDNASRKADDGTAIATTSKADDRKKGKVTEEKQDIIETSKDHTAKKDQPSANDDLHTTGGKKLRRRKRKKGEASVSNTINPVENKGDHTGKKGARLAGGGGGGIKKTEGRELLRTVRLSCMLLCLMRHFSEMEMEMTNCLLFLSCSLGEITLMMASLLRSEIQVVAPAAVEVVYKAFLLMGLLTAHTVAAELLGEAVVLVCMPELVAALVWLTIYLGICDDNAATRALDAVEKAVWKAVIPLVCLVGILAWIVPIITRVVADTDEGVEGAMDLLWGNMSSPIIAHLLSSLILSFICMLVLHKWHHQSWRRVQTTVTPSAELKGAIQLLSLCRDGSCKVLIVVLLANLMLFAYKLAMPFMSSSVVSWS